VGAFGVGSRPRIDKIDRKTAAAGSRLPYIHGDRCRTGRLRPARRRACGFLGLCGIWCSTRFHGKAIRQDARAISHQLQQARRCRSVGEVRGGLATLPWRGRVDQRPLPWSGGAERGGVAKERHSRAPVVAIDFTPPRRRSLRSRRRPSPSRGGWPPGFPERFRSCLKTP